MMMSMPVTSLSGGGAVPSPLANHDLASPPANHSHRFDFAPQTSPTTTFIRVKQEPCSPGSSEPPTPGPVLDDSDLHSSCSPSSLHEQSYQAADSTPTPTTATPTRTIRTPGKDPGNQSQTKEFRTQETGRHRTVFLRSNAFLRRTLPCFLSPEEI